MAAGSDAGSGDIFISPYSFLELHACHGRLSMRHILVSPLCMEARSGGGDDLALPLGCSSIPHIPYLIHA